MREINVPIASRVTIFIARWGGLLQAGSYRKSRSKERSNSGAGSY